MAGKLGTKLPGRLGVFQMKWLLFACGIVVGAAGGVAATTYLQAHRGLADQDDQIIFARKNFYNSEAAVIASGALTGPNLAYPNYYTIACYHDRNECIVANIEQIGHNQIGDMLAPVTFPVVKWDSDEIIAEDQAGLPNPIGCSKVTITIERQQKSALWVQEPVNQTQPLCRGSDTKINKWTIEAPPGWKRIFRPN